jgi:hypothetical protein
MVKSHSKQYALACSSGGLSQLSTEWRGLQSSDLKTVSGVILVILVGHWWHGCSLQTPALVQYHMHFHMFFARKPPVSRLTTDKPHLELPLQI